jgi:hypothetical protein
MPSSGMVVLVEIIKFGSQLFLKLISIKILDANVDRARFDTVNRHMMGNNRERRRIAVKMGKENLKKDIWSNER